MRLIFVKPWFLIVGVVLGVVGVALVAASNGRGTDPPPEGWTAAEWNALASQKQQQELQAYPSMVGKDPQAKTAWLAQHGGEGPDPAVVAEAAADTTSRPYSTGVVDSGQSPFDRSVYSMRNFWSGLVISTTPDKLYIVYAGMRLDMQTSQGQPMPMLIVRTIPWPINESQAGTVDTEYQYVCRSGPLKITSGSTSSISFVDAANTPGVFNMTTRTFNPACP